MEETSIKPVMDASRVLPVQKGTETQFQNAENRESELDRAAAQKTAEKTAQVPSDQNKLLKDINNTIRNFSTRVAFEVDPRDKTSKILVVDKETGKVIRQIPPDEAAELYDKMDEIAGIIFNRRV